MSNEVKRRYRWPWVVLLILLLGVVLFVLWMRVVVERVREQRFGTMGQIHVAPQQNLVRWMKS